MTRGTMEGEGWRRERAGAPSGGWEAERAVNRLVREKEKGEEREMGRERERERGRKSVGEPEVERVQEWGRERETAESALYPPHRIHRTDRGVLARLGATLPPAAP